MFRPGFRTAFGPDVRPTFRSSLRGPFAFPTIPCSAIAGSAIRSTVPSSSPAAPPAPFARSFTFWFLAAATFPSHCFRSVFFRPVLFRLWFPGGNDLTGFDRLAMFVRLFSRWENFNPASCYRLLQAVGVFVFLQQEIGDIEKRVTLQSDIDKCGLHSRQHARHPAFIDGTRQGVFVFTFVINFRKLVFFDYRNFRFVRRGRDI